MDILIFNDPVKNTIHRYTKLLGFYLIPDVVKLTPEINPHRLGKAKLEEKKEALTYVREDGFILC